MGSQASPRSRTLRVGDERPGIRDLWRDARSDLRKTVYVGLSAGSMVMTSYGTTYGHHHLPTETAKSLGLLDFAVHPHLDHGWFPDNSLASLKKLAASLPMPSYAIDDQTAIQVVDGTVKVISEGQWALFQRQQY